MGRKNLRSGKALSVPAGLAASLATNVMITFTLVGLTSYAVYKQIIAWEKCGYCIVVMLLVSSFLGTKVAVAAIKTQYFLIAVMSGLLYWGVLTLLTALFFGGNYGPVLETAALITAGSVTAVLIKRPARGRNVRNLRRLSC